MNIDKPLTNQNIVNNKIIVNKYNIKKQTFYNKSVRRRRCKKCKKSIELQSCPKDAP